MAQSLPMTITSTEGHLELTLTAREIILRLASEARDQANEEIVREAADPDLQNNGIPARIARFFLQFGQRIIHSSIACELTNIRSIAYRDGGIRIDYVRSGIINFEHVRTTIDGHDTRALDSFSPDDARRFVAAVQARLTHSA